MTHYQLPPNPPGWRSLNDDEVMFLREQREDLWADPKQSCLTCKHETKGGVKTFRTRLNGEIVVFDCDCLAQWKLSRWLLNSGVDILHQRHSWDDVINVAENAQIEVMKYLENAHAFVSRGLGLTLWSKDTGSGKTLLAVLLLKALLGAGHNGYFVQFNEMLDHHVRGWRNDAQQERFVKKVRNVGVLVVDDIGRESKGRENVTQTMFDMVLRARQAACKPTFITTNYTPDEMHQGYGGNVLSLLKATNTYVEVPGADYRPTVNQRVTDDALADVTYPFTVR